MKAPICLFILVCPVLSIAQNVKLVTSSRQSWSGGIAGRHGENYNFIVEFSRYKKEPLPDTLWIDGHWYPLTCMDSITQTGNAKRTRTKGKVKFDISIGTSYDEYAEHNPAPKKEKTIEPRPPIAFSGIALLSYRYNGKEHYFTISKILKTYPPISYP